MRLERGQRFVGFHVRHQAHIDLGHRAMRKNGFAARTGVAAHQAFNIHRRPRLQQLQRFLKTDVVHPVLDAVLLLGDFFIEAPGGFGDHLFSAPRAAAPCRQSRQSRDVCRRPRPECSAPPPDATPGCQSGPCGWSGCLWRAASPFLAAGDQFEFDHAFGAERHRDFAVGILRGRRH